MRGSRIPVVPVSDRFHPLCVSGSSSLPPELLPHLERFQRLTLWFPDDVVSWYAVRVFARKLAERRCFTVR